jgi:hypothetical protein
MSVSKGLESDVDAGVTGSFTALSESPRPATTYMRRPSIALAVALALA